MALLVQCDWCGAYTGAVWDFRNKNWRIPVKWLRFGRQVTSASGVPVYVCSPGCRDLLRATPRADGAVRPKKMVSGTGRPSLRLIAGGLDKSS